MRIRPGSGVRGLTGGPRRARRHRRPPPAPPGPRGLRPALREVWLEQLELAGLALDALLGLVRGHVAVLDDEAGDPPEVDRHERGDQRLERRLRIARGDDHVVDDPGPDVVREVERGDRIGHLEGRRLGRCHVAADPEPGPRGVLEPSGLGRQLHDGLERGRGEHPRPCVGQGQRSGLELGQQAERVHLERRRLDDPLEAVGRHVMAALDRHPVVGVAVGQPQDRADDLAEHRPEVGAGVLGVVDLGPEPGLADREPGGQRRGRHPDVDPEAADLGRPVIELEVVPDEVAAHPEVAADRLPDSVPVERPGERVGDGVGDRAVVLVAGVEGRDEVVAALEDGSGQQLDPFGDDAAQVRVDDDERLDVEGVGDLEDRPQRGPLAADAVDLGIGQADPLELAGRADQQDLLDVLGRLGLDHDPARAVGRSGVRVDDDRVEVGEVLDEPGLRRADHVADRRRVLETRDADHDVGPAESLDLVADGRRQGGLRHGSTVPPSSGRRPSGGTGAGTCTGPGACFSGGACR